MLKLVESATNYAPDMTRGVVVVESDSGPGKFAEAIEELSGNDAKHFALLVFTRQSGECARLSGSVSGAASVGALKPRASTEAAPRRKPSASVSFKPK